MVKSNVLQIALFSYIKRDANDTSGYDGMILCKTVSFITGMFYHINPILDLSIHP